jgi:predicted nuclease of predicted toxin-antitoxin system
MPAHTKYKWRLYADNDIEREIIDQLRRSGMDVLWISEDPQLRRQQDDRFHYQKAKQLKRYLLTRDNDFWDDRKHSLVASPGVLIVPATETDVAKLLHIVFRKLIDDANPLGEALILDGIKVRMGSKGFVIKGVDHDTQRVTVDTLPWKELF